MSSVIQEVAPLGFPWATVDPFLFCAYHNDAYPKGNGQMGPDPALLAGRQLGMDFEIKDGFRMYHGRRIPGFPSHPHRGFETVTLVAKGYCDHADSLGAAARFGAGDAQWITTGAGIVHSEMFPLLSDERDNPLELFQIWLNLPREAKMVPPHFSVLWSHEIPVVVTGPPGRSARVKVVAGQLGGHRPPAPPPHSWAANEASDIAIWTVELDAGAACRLPAARPGSHRALYYFEGSGAAVGATSVSASAGDVDADAETSFAPLDEAVVAGRMEELRSQHVHLLDGNLPLVLRASSEPSRLLLLQGRPIGQPVAQHGPFVMNTREEIQVAISDYGRTGFGGWPWPDEAPVHGKTTGRFALHADGRREEYERPQ